jgi:uncharacterized protein (TIGR01777 family)
LFYGTVDLVVTPAKAGVFILDGKFYGYLCAMQTVLITGGTGMVGQALTNYFIDRGDAVIVLTRGDRNASRPQLTYAKWDIEKQYIDPVALQQADIIVHLAGESVATKRWTPKRKQEIIDSRVQSGALLVKALQENKHKVKTVVAASAIGWYGPDTQASLQNGFKETDPFDHSYLGTTCKLWEESVHPLKAMGIRLVQLRIGIVLNKRGGALVEFIKPAKFGIATILGPGTQMVSWIHQQDLCKMIAFAADNAAVEGVYNAVAPVPVSNKDLVIAIASKMNKYYLKVPVPVFVLTMMLGEMSIEVLKSAKVSSEKIQAAGFEFDYGQIEPALHQLL